MNHESFRSVRIRQKIHQRNDLLPQNCFEMTSVPVPAASNPLRPVLPSHGVAKVKNVLSGDTVVLLGKAARADGKAPEVVFTFERVTAPR